MLGMFGSLLSFLNNLQPSTSTPEYPTFSFHRSTKKNPGKGFFPGVFCMLDNLPGSPGLASNYF
jgi:hypothetical protein